MTELLRALLMASPTALRPVDAVAACARLGLSANPPALHALLLEAEAQGLVRISGTPDAELQGGEIVTTGVQAELTEAGRARAEAGFGGML